MRLLFELDTKDYNPNSARLIRPSVRAIIIQSGRIAMIHSLKYNYYKFPGGGIENGENHLLTLLREVREEAGLMVIPDSVKAYGYVHRQQLGRQGRIFVQDNYYYFCQVDQKTASQELDPYESEEQFTLTWVLPEQAIAINQSPQHGQRSYDPHFFIMTARETKVLQLLQREAYFA